MHSATRLDSLQRFLMKFSVSVFDQILAREEGWGSACKLRPTLLACMRTPHPICLRDCMLHFWFLSNLGGVFDIRSLGLACVLIVTLLRAIS